MKFQKHRIALITCGLILLGMWYYYSGLGLSYEGANDPWYPPAIATNEMKPIMPSMPDQKAKEELGRASWKFFHTLLSRFPEIPTEQERKKLESFLYLYAELYPCGECSHHFVKMLRDHPPQTSSRQAAALWGCSVHNLVNKHLNKPIYNCNNVLSDYDCGCDGENDANAGSAGAAAEITLFEEEKQLG